MTEVATKEANIVANASAKFKESRADDFAKVQVLHQTYKSCLSAVVHSIIGAPLRQARCKHTLRFYDVLIASQRLFSLLLYGMYRRLR